MADKELITKACEKWLKSHDKKDFLPLAYEAVQELLSVLKEQENEKKRNPVIVCPHCGKRVK